MLVYDVHINKCWCCHSRGCNWGLATPRVPEQYSGSFAVTMPYKHNDGVRAGVPRYQTACQTAAAASLSVDCCPAHISICNNTARPVQHAT